MQKEQDRADPVGTSALSDAPSASSSDAVATRRSDKAVAIPKLKEEIFGFKAEDNICTVFDVDAKFTGANLVLTGNRGLMVAGYFQGTIQSDGAVFVGKDGEIHGEVSCRKLIVDGRVDAGDGLVQVKGMLALSGRASVAARKISYADVEMARGCRIVGSIEHGG